MAKVTAVKIPDESRGKVFSSLGELNQQVLREPVGSLFMEVLRNPRQDPQQPDSTLKLALLCVRN